MTFAFILIAIIAVFEITWWCMLFGKESLLNERELALDKQEVSLDEREKQNKEDFLTLSSMEDAEVVHSSYTVTDSDMMKYTTDAKVLSIAKNRIAHNIAYDIMHKCVPTVDEVDGKMRVSYKFKIKEAE